MSEHKNADGQAGQEHRTAPSQEGHAAGPACSAPEGEYVPLTAEQKQALNRAHLASARTVTPAPDEALVNLLRNPSTETLAKMMDTWNNMFGSPYTRYAAMLNVAVDAALSAQGGEQGDTVSVSREQIENMLKALRFYANGHHFGLSDPDAWDTVSGEPQNYYCDEAGTATVEDGSIAAAALRGEPADWLDGVEDCSPKAIKGELSILAAAKEGK
jgi:hypothetical protein